MPLTLVTIAPSHYCEKARWALDRAGMRYEERRHIPLLHYVVTVPVARQRTVPILVTPHGSITDSTEILECDDRALDVHQEVTEGLGRIHGLHIVQAVLNCMTFRVESGKRKPCHSDRMASMGSRRAARAAG